MNLANYRSNVALRLGNLAAGNPYYALLDKWINDAQGEIARFVIGSNRRHLTLFPELMNGRWQVEEQDGKAQLNLPTNLLVLDSVYSFDSATVPDHNTGDRRKLEYVTEAEFEQLKGRANPGDAFPTHWTRIANSLALFPTPTTASLTYLLLVGIKLPTDMTDPTHEPSISSIWHSAIEDGAVSLGAASMEDWEAAAMSMKERDRKLSQCISLHAASSRRRAGKLRVGSF